MEAADRYVRGLYAPKWKLVIEFSDGEAQELWGPKRIRALVHEVTKDCPWLSGRTPFLPEATAVTLRPSSSPDNGPETQILLEHNIRLTQKQLFAYEEWARKVAERVEQEISRVLLSMGIKSKIFWWMNMGYSGILQQEHAESYRIASRPGDVVRMKCGTLAIVTDYDIVCAGHAKELALKPACGIFRHLWLFWTGKLRPTEEQINELTKIGEVPLDEQ